MRIKVENTNNTPEFVEIEPTVFYALAIPEGCYNKEMYGDKYAKKSVNITTTKVYIADCKHMVVFTEFRDLIDTKDTDISKRLKDFYDSENVYYLKYDIISKKEYNFLLPYSYIALF